MRPIDASGFERELIADMSLYGEKISGDEAYSRALLLLAGAPTLTPPNEWVSVEERLPEKKQDVLMLFDTGNMAVGWWHDADEHITFWCTYTDDGFYTDCDCIPTHWMLLPAPPEKEGDR